MGFKDWNKYTPINKTNTSLTSEIKVPKINSENEKIQVRYRLGICEWRRLHFWHDQWILSRVYHVER